MSDTTIATPDDLAALRDANDRWYAALNAMIAGDPEPLKAVYSHRDDVTYMPAEGGLLVGWDGVYGDWVRQAEKSLGGRVEAADVQVILGEGFAVTCCHPGRDLLTRRGDRSKRAPRDQRLPQGRRRLEDDRPPRRQDHQLGSGGRRELRWP